VFLILTACIPQTATPSAAEMLLVTPQINAVCDACDHATLVAALTQEKQNTANQAAATAEIVRANAQATLRAANATQSIAPGCHSTDSNG